jgi:hypothetical protein
MKRAVFLVFLFISYNIYAFENYHLRWNLVNVGWGCNFFQNDKCSEEFFDFLNIGIENKSTGIGFEYIPIKYWYWKYNDNYTESRWSFLNFNINWNIGDLIFSDSTENFFKFYFGPFNSINYIYYTDKVYKWNEFIYTVGFRSGLGVFLTNNVYYNLVEVGIGYRNLNSKNTFYISAKIDIIPLLVIAFSSGSKETK